MYTVLYTITCCDALFDGYYDSKYKQELVLAKGEGVKFWQDWEVEDPEMKLLYCIFQNN